MIEVKCFQKNLFVNQVVNIGNDNEISMLKLAKIIKKILKSKSKIVHLKPLKDGDMLRRKPDISKMKKLLKRDFINLEKGIKTIT